MAFLTPGLRFISGLLILLLAPFILVSLISYALEEQTTWSLSTPVRYALSTLTFPFCLFLYILYDELYTRTRARKLGARPMPRPVKSMIGGWFGNFDVLTMMMRNSKVGYPGDGLWEFTARYGPVYNLRVLASDLIFTSNPEHIQKLLATDFVNYVKGARFQDSMRSVLGVGVFNSDGDMWKFHRTLTRPFFSRDRITHFELFDRHAEVAISAMKRRLRDGFEVDFQDLMGRFTLDSATEFLFGSCVNALDAGLPYPHHAPTSLRDSMSSGTATPTTSLSSSLGLLPTTATDVKQSNTERANHFTRAFLAAQEAVADRERAGPLVWPFFEIFEDRTAEPMRVIDSYILPIVAEAIARRKKLEELGLVKEKKEEVEEGETLLDHLVTISDDPVVLKDETLNIMIAGRDTTAATLSFIVYFLCQYPEVMKRLRAEILEHIGPDSKKPLGYEEVKECRYLRAVINETLRLYPVVPFNIREAIHETTWPSPDPTQPPLYVPAGTKTAYSVFMMHRRTDLWGPDAEEFDPDRFLDDRLKKYLTPRPFIFLPFNAGPRICLGQQFAYNEMSFMLIRLVQHFESFEFVESAVAPQDRVPSAWASSSIPDPLSPATQGAGMKVGGHGYRKRVDRIFPKMTLTMSVAGGLWIRAKEPKEALDDV